MGFDCTKGVDFCTIFFFSKHLCAHPFIFHIMIFKVKVGQLNDPGLSFNVNCKLYIASSAKLITIGFNDILNKLEC